MWPTCKNARVHVLWPTRVLTPNTSTATLATLNQNITCCLSHDVNITEWVSLYMCNELGGYMARFIQFPIMITRSTIIYEIISPGAAGSSIYV